MKIGGVTILAFLLSWSGLSESQEVVEESGISSRILQDTPCFTDLDQINALEDAVVDRSVRRTYVLCPQTTYTMATLGSDGSAVGGFAPLRPRTNAIFKCGNTGLSSNNCVLEGGDYAIFSLTPIVDNLTNALIQGLTMKGQARGAIVIARPGDVTFVDCIIREQSNNGAVQLLFSATGRRLAEEGEHFLEEGPHEAVEKLRRHLDSAEDISALEEIGEEEIVEDEGVVERGLQSTQRNLVVVFDRVLFEANSGVPSGLVGTTYPGIVTGVSTNIITVFQSTVFRNNVFTTPGAQSSYTYAVSVRAPTTFRNTCFSNNSFLGYAPVISIGVPAAATTILSVAASVNIPTALRCEFLARFSTQADLNSGTLIGCTADNSETCTANLATSPPSTAPPTPAPVIAPTTTAPVATTRAPVAATSAPVASPPSDCLAYRAPCQTFDQCCSDRCLFGFCERPFVEASNRNKLSDGRGGVGGVSKATRTGATQGGDRLLLREEDTKAEHRSKRIRGH